MSWQFGDFTLERQRRELRHRQDLVAVEGRVFDLIVALADNAHRIVTKDELIELVWHGRIVSDAAIASCVKAARSALNDSGKAQTMIKTIHGQGYRMVASLSPMAKDVDALPTSKAAQSAPSTLPSEKSALFGREQAIEQVRESLSANRLVSLTGIGGTGKTRLAIAAGHATADQFADGVFFVDLVPIVETDRTIAQIAGALGVSLPTGNSAHDLASIIKDRHLLLIVDNCEHIIDGVAPALAELIEHCPRLHILTTSREPLDLSDEFRLAVQPLATEQLGGDSPAAALFRATAARIGAPVQDDQMAQVGAACERLDGLPLAIELAAAQLRQLTMTELLERLDKRFDLLARRTRDGQARQSSLQAVLADTWQLLNDEERRLLGQLSVLPGKFSISDIETLTGNAFTLPVSSLFGSLVDKSLAKRDGAQWRLLETVRLFAHQQASDQEIDAFNESLVNWCLSHTGASVQRHCLSMSLAQWCDRHDAELLTAIRLLAPTDRTKDWVCLHTAQSLAMHRDNGTRAADMLRRLDNMSGDKLDDFDRTHLHFLGVMCAMAARSPEQLKGHGDNAVTFADRTGDPSLRAMALILASWTTVLTDPAQALIETKQAAELASQVNDEAGRDFAESYMAWHLSMQREYDAAATLARDIVERARPQDERYDYPVHSAGNAVAALIARSDPDLANHVIDHYCDARTDDSMWATVLLKACVRAARGGHVEAAQICVVVHERLTRAGINPLPDLLLPAAYLAKELGDDERASSWMNAVKSAGRPTQSLIMTLVYRLLSEEMVVTRQERLSDRAMDAIGDEALQWLQTQATDTS